MSDPRQRAWARFLIAHAVLIERIEAAFADAGLPSLDWYDVLWALESAKGGRLRMHDLARKVVVSRSNVTRLTDRMEKAGLVERSDCPEDGRGTVSGITDAGRKLRARMWPVYRKQIDVLFGKHLAAREAELIAAAFDKMIGTNPQRSTA
jgi:DNA-binding MarR family transcriptional regulator